MKSILFASALALSAAGDLPFEKPHILSILADDLGYNDVSFHSDLPQVETPNIDSILGCLHLPNHYSNPVCSPTRGSISTGRSTTLSTGIYLPFMFGNDGRKHLNESFLLTPQYLKRAAPEYHSHLIGKWHLGFNRKKDIPTERGYESYLGYFSGAEDYLLHTRDDGVDFHRNAIPTDEFRHQWSGNVFTEQVITILKDYAEGGKYYGTNDRFFIDLRFQNIHTPLMAPEKYVAMYNNTGADRLRYMALAMIKFLDDKVGEVLSELERINLHRDTLIYFASDNGGPIKTANNYPLRGSKNTIWQGGVNTVGGICFPGAARNKRASYPGLFHVQDVLPMFVHAASGQPFSTFIEPTDVPFNEGEGLDLLDAMLSLEPKTSPRNFILLEAHPEGSNRTIHGNGYIETDENNLPKWKLFGRFDKGPSARKDGWVVPSGQHPRELKINYTVQCSPNGPEKAGTGNTTECDNEYCLFDLSSDPCEYHNLAGKPEHQDVLKRMIARMKEFQAQAVPPCPSQGCDPTLKNDTGYPYWTFCSDGDDDSQFFYDSDAEIEASYIRAFEDPDS